VPTVIHTLADVVSKNGNLLLNIPVRGDGTIDDDELAVVEGIAAWMDVNQEAIFGTRPWKIFGEGPASDGAPITAQGFNEGKGKAFTFEDVRYTTKNGVVYAITLGRPTAPLHLKSLGTAAAGWAAPSSRSSGSAATASPTGTQAADGLDIEPNDIPAGAHTVVYRISLQ